MSFRYKRHFDGLLVRMNNDGQAVHSNKSVAGVIEDPNTAEETDPLSSSPRLIDTEEVAPRASSPSNSSSSSSSSTTSEHYSDESETETDETAPPTHEFTARQLKYLDRQYKKLDPFPRPRVFRYLANQLKVSDFSPPMRLGVDF